MTPCGRLSAIVVQRRIGGSFSRATIIPLTMILGREKKQGRVKLQEPPRQTLPELLIKEESYSLQAVTSTALSFNLIGVSQLEQLVAKGGVLELNGSRS